MSKIILLVVPFLFFIQLSWTQSSVKDSLIDLLSTVKGKQKVDVLNDLASHLLLRDRQESIRFSSKAYKLSKELKYTPGIIQSKILKGLYFQHEGKRDTALIELMAALQLSIETENDKKTAVCYGSIGNVKKDSYNFSGAIDYYEKSLEKYKQLGDSTGYAMVKLNIGTVYNYQGDLGTSLNCFFEALRVSENIGDYYLRGSCLNNISVIYNSQGDYYEALKYLEEAKELHLKNDNKLFLANVYNNIGMNYHDMDNYKAAIENYKKSLDINIELDDKVGISICFLNLGVVLFDEEKYEESMVYLNKSYKVAEEFGNKAQMVSALNNISDTYNKLGNSKKAVDFANKCLIISKETGVLEDIRESHLNLSDGYALMGDYKNALKHFELYTQVKDSLINESSLRLIEEMKARYNAEKKEQELKIKEAEVEVLLKEQEMGKMKRLIYIVISSFILVFALLIIIWQRGKMKKNQKITLLEKNNLLAEIEYKNKEIVNFALHIVEKNDFLDKLKSILSESAGKEEAWQIKRLINENLSLEQDREEFNANVEQVNEAFFMKLEERFPKITKNEKRLCVFLRLNLSSKEIATVLNISPSSVDINRYRLRKKLNITGDENLSEFLNTI